MPESKTNTVTFKQRDAGRNTERSVTYVASRPEVLPTLKEITQTSWGWWLGFQGTEAELILAGVANAAMFEIGKSVQRKYEDEFGDYCTLKRRGKKKWDLEYHMHNETGCGLPSDDRPGKCPWWIKWGSEAEATTAEILKRFARPPG
jgi:hypothetical protein